VRLRRRAPSGGRTCDALRRQHPRGLVGPLDIICGIECSVELEPEVEQWLQSLRPADFAVASFHLDRLAARGSELRMPRSRSLGDGLFELRFDMGRAAWRITYWFAPERRAVMLTVFRKQRMNERVEVDRARKAMAACIAEGHTAEEGS
jgi:hypothetical protein